MKRAKFIWAALPIVLLFSCSDQWAKKKIGTFRSIDLYHAQLEKAFSARGLAEEGTAPVCMKDRLSAKNVLAEIARAEATRTGTSSTGLVGGVDLAKLSPTAGEYLKQNSDLLDTTSFATAATSTECASSITCLLQSIYTQAYQTPAPADGGPTWSTPVGDEGALLYHWQTKMGITLASAANTPGLSGITAPLGRYLFSSEELRILNEIAFRTPAIYRKMWPVRSMHKVPYPYKKRNSDGSTSSAIADATLPTFWISAGNVTNNPGYIRLFHDGMRISRIDGNSRWDTSLRETTVHELSHELDYMIDNPNREMSRISDSKLWLDLSGWRMVSAIGGNGLVDYEWKSDPNAEGFVRWYAGTSPAEDFADTAAYFRLEPSRLETTPKKKALISGMLYGGRTFDDPGLLEFYQSFVEKELTDLIPKQLEACRGVLEPSQVPTADVVYVGSAQIGLSVNGIFRKQCLEALFNRDLEEQFRRLRYHEWEACDFLKPSVIQVIATRQARAWASKVNELNARTEDAGPLADALKKSLAEFEERFDAREAYVACYGNADEETCYDSTLSQMYDAWLSRQPESLRQTLLLLKPLHLKQNTYDTARMRAIDSVNTLIAGASVTIWEKTQALWNSCKSNRSELTGTPRLEPYSGGEYYVRGSILDCVNRQIRDVYRKLLNDYARTRFQWTSENALSLAIDRVVKKAQWILNLQVRRAANEEFAKWEALYPEAIAGRTRPEADCMNQIEPQMSSWYQTLPSTRRIAEDYYPKQQIHRYWAFKFCRPPSSS